MVVEQERCYYCGKGFKFGSGNPTHVRIERTLYGPFHFWCLSECREVLERDHHADMVLKSSARRKVADKATEIAYERNR